MDLLRERLIFLVCACPSGLTVSSAIHTRRINCPNLSIFQRLLIGRPNLVLASRPPKCASLMVVLFRSSGGEQQFVRLERIQFVGACNPPTDPGRKPLAHRLYIYLSIYLNCLSTCLGLSSYLISIGACNPPTDPDRKPLAYI